MPKQHASDDTGLRRDLGSLGTWATLIGMLIGAGIFRVTSDAWQQTGPSVIMGHLVLAVAILGAAVPYAFFASTSLGRLPGGEYAHVSRAFGRHGAAFLATWLKIISYVGALAYLANALADYVLHLVPGADPDRWRVIIATTSLLLFLTVHVLGVRWFSRAQVAMCGVLCVSLLVLLIPGLFAIETANYRPFFAGGGRGFAASLPALFFAYAGFEALAQTGGEVKDASRRIPRTFLLGISATTVIYLLMSVVTFGVLPGDRLATSTAPMSDVASVYLPAGAAAIVTIGAIMAIATSLNSTMLVPSRLLVLMARDRVVPGWLGRVSPGTGTPLAGLALTFLGAEILLLLGMIGAALTIAVLALLWIYLAHGITYLLLPRLNPELWKEATWRPSRVVHWTAGLGGVLAMAMLMAVQLASDVAVMSDRSLGERLQTGGITGTELVCGWAVLGGLLWSVMKPRRV